MKGVSRRVNESSLWNDQDSLHTRRKMSSNNKGGKEGIGEEEGGR